MQTISSWPLFPDCLPPDSAASLSLQFLIVHWIDASSWLQKLDPETKQVESMSEKLHEWFVVSFGTLLPQGGGILDKLCFYVDVLLQNWDPKEESLILEPLHELRSDALYLKTALFQYKKGLERRCIGEVWKEWIKKTELALKTLFEGCATFIEEFREDENLLFLLIEQKDPLNQYLGHSAVETVLSRLFPQGPCTLRETIYNGYARRGFLDFYTKNEELIESIAWEDRCPPSNLKSES